MNDMDIEDTREPRDEPEAEVCEFCGQEMEYHCMPDSSRTKERWFECTNKFCPDKFSNKVTYMGDTLIEMANHLAEVEQELADTKSDLKYAKARIDNLKLLLKLLLTPSQEGEE